LSKVAKSIIGTDDMGMGIFEKKTENMLELKILKEIR